MFTKFGIGATVKTNKGVGKVIAELEFYMYIVEINGAKYIFNSLEMEEV